MNRPIKHRPQRTNGYLNVHWSTIESFVDTGFVTDSTVAFVPLGRNLAFLAGEIGCCGKLVLTVFKRLGYVDEDPEHHNPLIQCRHYAYNLHLEGGGNIFRYDNQHVHGSHPDEHHCHHFAWPSFEELPNSPVWVGADGWPHIGTILEDARRWHENHNTVLQYPWFGPAVLRSGFEVIARFQ